MKFVGIFTFLLLMNLHFSLAQTAPTAIAPSASDIVYLSPEENQFYILLNQFRSQLGLPTVQIHVFLQNAAKKHSEWMASKDFLTHYGPEVNKTPFQRMNEEGYVNYTFLGENVACGNGDAIKTFRQWAFSPGHLANMINPHFRHIGISRAGTGNEQCPYYWTNDFGSMTDMKLDSPEITDLQKISEAVIVVSGAIPEDKKIQLPIEQQNGTVIENKNYSLIQCMIPNSLAKNILTFTPNTDALMDITPNSTGGYSAKVSYLQNGAAADFYPMNINNVSVVKNATYPLILIFATTGNRNNGFLIQFDTSKSSAEFDPYPSSSSEGGSVVCSYKM